MDQIQAIYRWIAGRGSGSLESTPYEELFRSYGVAAPRDKRAIYDELCRRLSRLVYLAAYDYAKRQGLNDLESHAERLKDVIFRAFVPEMGAGEPEFGLCRLATRIRMVLDEEAFQCIAGTFYYQLPLYHVPDDEQRRFLAVMFQEWALSTEEGLSHIEQLAERFHVSVSRAEAVVKAGLKRLKKVIAGDFEKEELRKLTEGHVTLGEEQ